MKVVCMLCILICCRVVAWTQVESGTTGYFEISHDEVTVAMDSGSRNPDTGKEINTQCKISALGNKVVFTFTGHVRDAAGTWSAHAIARQVWQRYGLKDVRADRLVTRMVTDWTAEMHRTYDNVAIIRAVEAEHNEEPILGSGIFFATDSRGGFAMKGAHLLYNRPLFVARGKVDISHEPIECPSNDCNAGIGHDEVINEFRQRTSDRAKEFMGWFGTKTEKLSPSQRVIQMATQLVELSILLQPGDPPLRFPVDVVQLRRGKSVEWIYKKDSCPAK